MTVRARSHTAPSSAGSSADSRHVPPSVEPKPTRRVSVGGTGGSPGSGSGSGSRKEYLPRTRASWGTVVVWASSATWASMDAGAWRHTRLTWSSLSEPASKAARVSGSSGSRRAMATRARARRGDTPQRHPTQCSAERMPQPAHAPVSSTWPMRPTSRPVAALSTPQTSAISASSRSPAASTSSTP
jgi:hypothetical protein